MTPRDDPAHVAAAQGERLESLSVGVRQRLAWDRLGGRLSAPRLVGWRRLPGGRIAAAARQEQGADRGAEEGLSQGGHAKRLDAPMGGNSIQNCRVGVRSERMARRFAALLSLSAACVSLALVPVATAAGKRHVPSFDLLVRPVAVSKLPPSLRIGFEAFGKHGRKARVGQVRLAEGVLTAAGNNGWICSSFRAKGEPKFGGSGGCSPRKQAVREGLIGICGDESGRLRIDGLVPNGVATIELDRDSQGPTVAVPVVRNAFAAPLPHANLTFRALSASGEVVIEHRYPLAEAHGVGCYSFFEASR